VGLLRKANFQLARFTPQDPIGLGGATLKIKDRTRRADSKGRSQTMHLARASVNAMQALFADWIAAANQDQGSGEEGLGSRAALGTFPRSLSAAQCHGFAASQNTKNTTAMPAQVGSNRNLPTPHPGPPPPPAAASCGGGWLDPAKRRHFTIARPG
jgi:hypothetical protein